MQWIPIRTRKILPPKDDLYAVLGESLPKLHEGDVLFITSKVLAIHQGQCVKIGTVDKKKLIRREAERLLASTVRSDFVLTIKHSTLIPSAGIDESNGKGYCILWPKNPSGFAKEFWRYLKRKFGLKKLAVVITDSHTTPLRSGVIGISVGFFGLEPVADRRGARDVFGRKLKHTKVNIIDALSAGAVLAMGEARERTPIVILRDAKGIRFTNRSTWRKIAIPAKKDLYYPLLKYLKSA